MLTSHYTLDAGNPAARREIAALADLIGAVRLPTGAHRRAAGTDALTDLLIFRRRQPHSPPRSTEWQTTRPSTSTVGRVRINSYLADHPDRILGELALGHGMYGSDTLLVRPRGALDTLPAQLHDVLSTVRREARADGLTFAPSVDTSSGPTRQSATDVSRAAPGQRASGTGTSPSSATERSPSWATASTSPSTCPGRTAPSCDSSSGCATARESS